MTASRWGGGRQSGQGSRHTPTPADPPATLELDLPLLALLPRSVQPATAESRVWVLYTKRILISPQPRRWTSKIKAPADHFLGRLPVLSHLAVYSPGGRLRGSLGSLISLLGAPPS